MYFESRYKFNGFSIAPISMFTFNIIKAQQYFFVYHDEWQTDKQTVRHFHAFLSGGNKSREQWR